METIYHLARADDWASAGDEYAFTTVGVPLEPGAFMHCSFGRQVHGVAERFYADRSDLVVLAIDPSRLEAEVKVEALGASEAYPHIYGPLPRAAVLAVTPWSSDWQPGH